MKFLTVFLFIAFFSCKNSSETSVKTSKDSVADQKLFMPSYAVNNFEGTYNGNFDDGFITVVLNYVQGKNVSGYNLHKGQRRSINGTLEAATNGYKFILKEPGDNPYDGTFEFTIDTANFSLAGLWKPFDAAKTNTKKLSLQKQAKKLTDNYDDELGVWVPASGTYNTDTTLDFSPEGTCEYRLYAKPGDAASQMNTVKGNYVISKDTVFIEWQKNSFTPAQKMKLVRKKKVIKEDGYEREEQQLIGNGWKLSKFEAG